MNRTLASLRTICKAVRSVKGCTHTSPITRPQRFIFCGVRLTLVIALVWIGSMSCKPEERVQSSSKTQENNNNNLERDRLADSKASKSFKSHGEPDPFLSLSSPAVDDVKISGVIMVQSDIADQPDVPLEIGIVIAVPSDDMASVLAAVPGAAARMVGKTYPPMLLNDDLVSRYVRGLAEVDTDGSFSLTLPPGEYLLGIGNAGRVNPRTLPIGIHGWAAGMIIDKSSPPVILLLDGDAGTVVVR